MSSIKKAIIIAAGYGTRRLPITKVVDKCMLPIGNRPLIDFVVDDCIKAGIEEIIFVVSENSSQIHDYYSRSVHLEKYLASKNDQTSLEMIREIENKAKFRFVEQKGSDPYGTAVPIWLCRDLIEQNESFLYVSGDQFYYHSSEDVSEAKNLIELHLKTGLNGAMLAVEVPHEEVYKYGIVSTESNGSIELYKSIVEKPKVEDAPTNLNNGTMWLFGQDIFTYIEDIMNADVQGEYSITDVANNYVSSGREILVVRSKGKYLDGGTELGWLEANNYVLNTK